MKRGMLLLALVSLLLAGPAVGKKMAAKEKPMKIEIAKDVQKRLNRFRETVLVTDGAALNKKQQACMKHLLAAGKLMDQIFMQQVYDKNAALKKELASLTSPLAGPAQTYFELNFGPFDRLNENESFLGHFQIPAGANFYPADMTKEEFNRWLKKHPQDREAFVSPFTVIRRQGKNLVAIPYSEAYADWLKPAAAELKHAAKICENSSLKKFLVSRADAFLSNNYRQSDMDWMDVTDNQIDVTIGPYEVYEDRLFGYKAAFEVFVAVRDAKASAALATIKKHYAAIEKNLPLPEKLRGPERGKDRPISVVNLAFSGGDTKAGVQTIAFNLPNDENVRAAKGYKLVLLANIMKAKFDNIVRPIAGHVLRDDQLKYLSANAFIENTLHHEVSHGMGPGKIKNAKGEETTVNLMLKELYPHLEEAKADIMGLYNQIWLIDQGILPKTSENEIFATFLAGAFRSVRFGTDEAHGKANLMNFNYLLEKGAYALDQKSGRFYFNADKMRSAVRDLVAANILLQAKGDYAETKKFLKRYGKMSASMKKALAKLADVPVDILPRYPLAG